MSACRIGFVMEQTMGHVTYQRSLAAWSKNDPSIIPTWFPIQYWRPDVWSRVPGVRNNASMYLSLRARDDLRRARAASHNDVLFFHTQGTAMCSVGFARRVPVVVSLDATPINMDTVAEGYNHRPDDDGAVSRLKRSIYRWVFRKAAALTTWNQWAKDSLIRDYLVPPDKVEVIPPGVDLELWRTDRSGAGLKASPRLLFVGGDFARKGGDVLMDALRAGLSERCEVDLVTGTEGIESNDRVRVHRGLTPADPALRRLFDEADVFVLPTRADCSPMAIVEAMAAGLPVVTTDVGAISEQIVDGETGLLTRPGDPADLGRALAELLNDPERLKTYGAAGRARAERCYDGPRNYTTLINLLKRSAGAPASAGSAAPDDEGNRRAPIGARAAGD